MTTMKYRIVQHINGKGFVKIDSDDIWLIARTLGFTCVGRKHAIGRRCGKNC
jgi:hypothetical protein